MRAIPFLLFIVFSPELIAELPLAAGLRFTIWFAVATALFLWGLWDLEKRFSW